MMFILNVNQIQILKLRLTVKFKQHIYTSNKLFVETVSKQAHKLRSKGFQLFNFPFKGPDADDDYVFDDGERII